MGTVVGTSIAGFLQLRYRQRVSPRTRPMLPASPPGSVSGSPTGGRRRRSRPASPPVACPATRRWWPPPLLALPPRPARSQRLLAVLPRRPLPVLPPPQPPPSSRDAVSSCGPACRRSSLAAQHRVAARDRWFDERYQRAVCPSRGADAGDWPSSTAPMSRRARSGGAPRTRSWRARRTFGARRRSAGRGDGAADLRRTGGGSRR